MDGSNRRTLRFISEYPTPEELLNKIQNNFWPYKDQDRKDLLDARDKALAALLYLAAIRVSEARRLTLDQFKDKPFRIVGLELSKSQKINRKTGKVITRKDLYRKEIMLPHKGARGQLTGLIKTYITLLTDKPTFTLKKPTYLFKISTSRMEQIIGQLIGIPPHWLRAYGENYLYELWDNDLIAVSNYVQVDPATLQKYIHRTPKKYLKRE